MRAECPAAGAADDGAAPGRRRAAWRGSSRSPAARCAMPSTRPDCDRALGSGWLRLRRRAADRHSGRTAAPRSASAPADLSTLLACGMAAKPSSMTPIVPDSMRTAALASAAVRPAALVSAGLHRFGAGRALEPGALGCDRAGARPQQASRGGGPGLCGADLGLEGRLRRPLLDRLQAARVPPATTARRWWAGVSARGAPAVRRNLRPPDGRWAGNEPMLLVDLRGREAAALDPEASRRRSSATLTPDSYLTWPGPELEYLRGLARPRGARAAA